MKNLAILKGAKMLSKKEQRTINGGIGSRKPELCSDDYPLVVCYFPTHCAIGPNGTSICV